MQTFERRPRPKKLKVRVFVKDELQVSADRWRWAVDPRTGRVAVFKRRDSAKRFLRNHYPHTRYVIVPADAKREERKEDR